MGGGSYSYTRDVARKAANAAVSREEVFAQKKMSEAMNICGKVRECCDSEEHPNTFPIVIALDVTGSMGRIPYELCTQSFPKIMQRIMEAGVKDPQVCFVGIGDQYSDDAPIQVGQFEASDDLLDKWLKNIWLEGGGGGNNGESYQLAWYFAAHHVNADAFSKRNVRGALITIGDEPTHRSIDTGEVRKLFGDSVERDITADGLLLEASVKWHVWHINLKDWAGMSPETQSGWKNILGERFVNTDASGLDIPTQIADIVISAYKQSSAAEVNFAPAPTTIPLNLSNHPHIIL